MYVEHAALQFGDCIPNTNRPAQRHDAAKLSETTFGAMVRNNFSTVGPAFLFSPDAEFGVGKSYLDLVGGHARQLDANGNGCFRFTKIDWWRPRAGCERVLRFSRLLQSRVDFSDTIAKLLYLESF
jgi:hypothetical protein